MSASTTSKAIHRRFWSLRAAAFAGTPYGARVVGQRTDTKRVSAEDVKAFLDRWYSPSNAVLIVAGDLDLVSLRELVEAHFSKISGRAIQKRERRPSAEPTSRRVWVQSRDKRYILWGRTYVAPSFSTANPRKVLSLQLLARILEYRASGRLNRAPELDRQIAEEIAVDYDPEAVGPTAFTIHARLLPTADITEFERLIESEVVELATKGVSEAELTKARKEMLSELAETWDDPFEAANLVGAALATSQDIGAVVTRRRPLSEIQAEDIGDAAREIFAGNKGITGVVRASGNSPARSDPGGLLPKK